MKYEGPERREAPTMEAIELMLDRLLEAHEQREEKLWEERMARAFPKGDLNAHCAYHQNLIDAAEEQKKFWQAAQHKLIERGIDGALGAIKVILTLAIAGLALKMGIKIPFFGE